MLSQSTSIATGDKEHRRRAQDAEVLNMYPADTYLNQNWTLEFHDSLRYSSVIITFWYLSLFAVHILRIDQHCCLRWKTFEKQKHRQRAQNAESLNMYPVDTYLNQNWAAREFRDCLRCSGSVITFWYVWFTIHIENILKSVRTTIVMAHYFKYIIEIDPINTWFCVSGYCAILLVRLYMNIFFL